MLLQILFPLWFVCHVWNVENMPEWVKITRMAMPCILAPEIMYELLYPTDDFKGQALFLICAAYTYCYEFVMVRNELLRSKREYLAFFLYSFSMNWIFMILQS